MNNISEEENIAKNLVKYLQKDEFKNRSLASIDRIIDHYFNKYNNNPAEEKEVISFLFKYLKEKKEPASILFRHIKNTPEANNIIKRLYYEHRWDFNFDVISSSLFLTSFDFVKINERLKKTLYFFAIFIPLLAIVSISLHNKTTSLKAEFKEQLDNKSIQLQNEIMIKEKLESELSLLKKNYENDLKTKEQLGSEIVTLKKNLQDEMLNIKQHLENELTSVKEKQQEANELSNCKENLQQEKLDKIQIESELITCKENLQQEKNEHLNCKENLQQETNEHLTCEENLQQEKLNKNQIETKFTKNKEQSVNETKKEKRKIKFNFLQKINRKMLIFFGIDILMLIIVILYLVFSDKSVENINYLILSFVFEIALNLQFLFDYNSFTFYFCFSVVFILSITILLFVSDRNDLSNNVEYITAFLYITNASTYKYTLINNNNNFWTISYLIFCLAFIIECIAIFVIHYRKTDYQFLLIDEVALFIFYSNIEKSPLCLSNIAFICLLIYELIITFDGSVDIYIGALSFVTLIKYCLFVFVKHYHLIFYIVVSVILIIEIISAIYFKDEDWVFLICFDICSSLLWVNFNIFVYIIISIILIVSTFYIIFDIIGQKKNRGWLIIILLTLLTKYIFSILKVWRLYRNMIFLILGKNNN